MNVGFLFFILAYLAGSVNFSILLFKLMGKDDPRDSYSGNAGTTNVYRQAGLVWAAVVLLLDIGRAVLTAFLAGRLLTEGMIPWACLFLVAGNRYPLFHGFRGGKGVANYLGFTFFISPWAGAVSCAAWVLVYAAARVPFIASFFMLAVLAAGTGYTFRGSAAAVAGAMVTAAFIFFNHRENIRKFREQGGSRGARKGDHEG